MAESTFAGFALIYGGSGALGTGCVSHFKSRNWWVASVTVWKHYEDMKELGQNYQPSVYVITDSKDLPNQHVNKEADINILVQTDTSIEEQQNDILECLNNLLDGTKLDAVICVAGGYANGNLNTDFIVTCEKMWKQNVWPSILSAVIGTTFLKQGGMLCLTGAKAALEGTPNTIAYGLCKTCIHQLTKSLAGPGSGLPKDVLCIALLPVTLDTVMNRQMMPTADISGWTPTKYITDLLLKWSNHKERPINGSLIQFVTHNFNTDITFL